MTDIEIESFLAIVHAGSISKAAVELYTSQSSLSRRIQSLEAELGFQLFIRNKGNRSVRLTKAGMAFIDIAAKWKSLWKDMQNIGSLDNKTILNISVINSVNAYIMPGFLQKFILDNPWIYLTVRSVPSLDTFRYIENGIVDLALFSDDSYISNSKMRPAYSEQLLLVCHKDTVLPEEVSPEMFDISKNLYLPWNREYEAWHHRWFPASKRSRVWFNNIKLMEEFLLHDYWAIVPASAAHKMALEPGLSVHTILNGPPPRIIYYLLGPYPKSDISRMFLTSFDQHLKRNHSNDVISLIDLGM